MAEREKKGSGLLFKLALVLIACYFIYFAFLLAHLYAVFHEYSDFGIAVTSLYFNTQLPQIAHGFQLLTLGEHISPDALGIMGIYALVPSPLTLLILQDAVISLTALIILLAVRDLAKSDWMAFAFCIAFLINPGTLGQMLFDSHIEFLITPFYVLTIYYYLKGHVKGFAISSILLLGTADVAPFMALTLGVALILYEFLYNKRKTVTKSDARLAITLVVLSLLFMGAYAEITNVLAQGYPASYPGLPPYLYVTNGAQVLIGPSLASLLHNPVGQLGGEIGLYLGSYKVELVYSILLIIFAFGLTALADPVPALVMLIPWLGGAFVVGLPAFVFPTSQYFGYVIGPAFGMAIIGLLIVLSKKSWLYKVLAQIRENPGSTIKIAAIALPILFSIIGPAAYLLVSTPQSAYHSINTANLGQLLLFQSNASQKSAYAQLYSAIAQVPANASVLTNYFIIAHLSQRQYAEQLGNGGYFFNPQYILVDENLNVSSNACNIPLDNCTRLDSLLDSGNYSLIFENGTAMLYITSHKTSDN